jgi:hypothetical protein
MPQKLPEAQVLAHKNFYLQVLTGLMRDRRSTNPRGTNSDRK